VRLLALAALLAAAVPARAVIQTVGTTSAEFLRLGAGARSLGMGEAYTAVADGADALYWNPGGLARLSRAEAVYSRTELPAGLHHDYLAVALPSALFRGTFAFGVTRLSQDKLALVDASNQTVGSFSPHSEAYSFGYGHRFADNDPVLAERDYFRENWNLPRVERPYNEEREPWTGEIEAGAAAKLISESYGTRSASSFAFDAGAQYRPSYLHELILACAVRDVGGKLRFIRQSDPLPAEAAFSAAYESRSDSWTLLPAVELDAPYAGNFNGKAGVEAAWEVSPGMTAAGRLGYSTRTVPALGALSGLTGGVGVGVGAFRFDAAFEPMAALGSGLRVGAGWKF
jgi:hypothetical protein